VRGPRLALISLGSDIHPEVNLPAAARLLAEQSQISVVAASRVYQSPPLGRPDDAPFRNAAVMVRTSLGPAALHSALRRIESLLGRVRTDDRYAPRTIDLDLAMYQGVEGVVAGRLLPDPDIPERAFLAVPLAEVAPGWFHRGAGRTLARIAARFHLGEDLRLLPGTGLGVGPISG
jgi:2-amino-4-hydroxy-6-hydroxymethyldihydropteridine diphosphokinase